MYHMRTEDSKTVLGDSTHPKTCRFCGRTEPEVSFHKEAHAIPRCVGNNRLFSNYECDSCNEDVFSKYEAQFSEMMKLAHSLSQTKGRKGVPSYKPNMQQDSRIDVGSEGISIKQYPDAPDFVVLNENDGKTPTITVTGEVNYRPIDIAKILTKMAITVLPENEMQNFVATKKWLLRDSTDEKSVLQGMRIDLYLYPGNHPFPFPTCGLYKKKDNGGESFPYLLFFLCYSNFMFQTFIPYCEKDRKAFATDKPVTITIPRIPNVLDYQGLGCSHMAIDCSSNELVKKPYSIHLTASEAIAKDVNEKD